MKKKLTIITIFTVTMLFGLSLKASTEVWDLQALYGITQDGIANAISDAKSHFSSNPNDTIIIEIAAGTYDISGSGSHGIDLTSGLKPGPNGRLIFQGAGMEETTLVFETRQRMMSGFNVYQLEFRDMHMTCSTMTVTQGTVVSVSAGEIVLDIEEGFPTPLELFNDWGQGRYLRRYTKSQTDPQLIQDNNDQEVWGWRNGAAFHPELVSGNQWRIFLNSTTRVLNNYSVGDYVGIKSKHEGEIYWFATGNDLVFRNIKWTQSSRGLVRNGFSNVGLYGCRIERAAPINGQTPCLSTPSGGPQMNQPLSTGNSVSTNMVLEDCFIDSPGDDNIAFFNVTGGVVKNCIIRNGFARGILATVDASDICVTNTVMENAYLFDESVTPDGTYFTVSEATSELGKGAFNQFCAANVINATNVMVSPSSVTLDSLGQSFQLAADVSPTDATYKVVLWSSSDPSVVDVDENGIVTANGEGTTTVTVVTIDGNFTSSATVTVMIPIPPIITSAQNRTRTSAINIFPNPTTSLLNINIQETREKLSAVVVDLSGRELIRKELETERNIFNLDSLPVGVYLLRIKRGNLIIENKRILKTQ